MQDVLQRIMLKALFGYEGRHAVFMIRFLTLLLRARVLPERVFFGSMIKATPPATMLRIDTTKSSGSCKAIPEAL